MFWRAPSLSTRTLRLLDLHGAYGSLWGGLARWLALSKARQTGPERRWFQGLQWSTSLATIGPGYAE